LKLCCDWRRHKEPVLQIKLKSCSYDYLLSTKSWGRMGEWRYSSVILNLCNSWRWVVSFTLWPLYLSRKHWLVPTAIMGPTECKHITLPPLSKEPGPSSPWPVTIPTELSNIKLHSLWQHKLTDLHFSNSRSFVQWDMLNGHCVTVLHFVCSKYALDFM
jgi:hypothetical protein